MQNSQFPAGKHLDLSERLNRLFAGLHHLLGYHIATHCDIHSKQTTGGPSSSCIMIILRNKIHSEIIRVWRKIFTTAPIKNTVKFSITIPHLTSTEHRLSPDRLLCWKEAILASYSFLGLLHKRRTKLHAPFPNDRSEKRKIHAQNDRAATNPARDFAIHCGNIGNSIISIDWS